MTNAEFSTCLRIAKETARDGKFALAFDLLQRMDIRGVDYEDHARRVVSDLLVEWGGR